MLVSGSSNPDGQVLTVAPAVCLGVGEDHFKPPAQPRRGFRLGGPYRLEHGEDVGGGDRGARQRAERRRRVGFDRAAPLCRVLVVAPAGFVRLDVSPRRFNFAQKLADVCRFRTHAH